MLGALPSLDRAGESATVGSSANRTEPIDSGWGIAPAPSLLRSEADHPPTAPGVPGTDAAKRELLTRWGGAGWLLHALEGGHLEVAQWLAAALPPAPGTFHADRLRTIVHYACERGDVDLLRWVAVPGGWVMAATCSPGGGDRASGRAWTARLAQIMDDRALGRKPVSRPPRAWFDFAHVELEFWLRHALGISEPSALAALGLPHCQS